MAFTKTANSGLRPRPFFTLSQIFFVLYFRKSSPLQLRIFLVWPPTSRSHQKQDTFSFTSQGTARHNFYGNYYSCLKFLVSNAALSSYFPGLIAKKIVTKNSILFFLRKFIQKCEIAWFVFKRFFLNLKLFSWYVHFIVYYALKMNFEINSKWPMLLCF